MTLYPEGCIKASDLHSLAAALNRLEAWHRNHGGPRDESPCLRMLIAREAGKITAIVTSGDLTWTLALREGAWIFLGDALKE